ncbi:hypothetical protein TNCV_3057821 [Trichonephila clavipes]|nr:hypothetical protein TNCV_3057821 [Trichonephila clavipes]
MESARPSPLAIRQRLLRPTLRSQTWYSCALRMLQLGAFIHKIQIWKSADIPEKLHFAMGPLSKERKKKCGENIVQFSKKEMTLAAFF